MGRWRDATWRRRIDAGVRRADLREGPFQWFEPAPLTGLPIALPPELDREVARAESAIRALAHPDHVRDLARISRFLLRSEAIASSRIEGITPSPRKVALAELSFEDDQVPSPSTQADLVARNMTVVHEATSTLIAADEVGTDHLVRLQAALLPDRADDHGLRTVQNWIGGSDYHPIDADFVPPAPEAVPALMDDLLVYLGGAQHSPVVQAALVHAQFETIHPFVDGNGRVGRALIHTVLSRRGVTPAAILPISSVLATFRTEYVEGLTRFRHAEGTDPLLLTEEARAATNQWIGFFVTALTHAAAQAGRLASDIHDLREDWRHALEEFRRSQGRTRSMRNDSATARILADLPATPVMTVKTAARMHGVSSAAAATALAELEGAKILTTQRAGRSVAYLSREILDLVAITERRLGSTRFDTLASPPRPGLPALPE